jgi:hypothetical protein
LAREKLGARYVMLVGDAANFPVRFWYLHQSTPAYANNDPIPTRPWGVFIQSDLYYASLYHHTGTYPNIGEGAFDNWDANGNGLYNEAWLGNGISDPANTAGGLNTACNPDGVDGYPDIAVGRVPAASAADVQTYVNKIIAYESRSAPEKLTFTFVADQIYGDFDATTGIAGTLSGRNVAIDYLMIENTGAAESPFSKQLAVLSRPRRHNCLGLQWRLHFRRRSPDQERLWLADRLRSRLRHRPVHAQSSLERIFGRRYVNRHKGRNSRAVHHQPQRRPRLARASDHRQRYGSKVGHRYAGLRSAARDHAIARPHQHLDSLLR